MFSLNFFVIPTPAVREILLIGSISKKYTILLFGGGENEVKQLKTISEENENVFSLAGGASLTCQLDFISNLDLMISMDSANGHIAALLGIKVLTIWGVTHPYAGFGPYGQPDQNNILVDRSQYPKIPTSIYGDKFPKGYENAISSISSAKIIEALKTLV